MKFRFVAFCSSILALSVGCNQADDCFASDVTIEQYLADSTELQDRALRFEDTELFYIIEEEGAGPGPELGDTVNVIFSGMTTNGDVFNEKLPEARSFLLSELISGWQNGLPLIGEGGRIRLFVPSFLAYGPSQVANVCPSSDLVFDVELVSF